MRVGIVCEGTTDYEVLTVIVRKVVAPRIPTFTLLQPDVDRLTGVPVGPVEAGWQAVRKFLSTSEAALDMGTLDLVVVHVDADIEAIVAREIVREPDDADGGLDGLCRHVKSWIGAVVPGNVIIALPRAAVEAWLLAAHTNLKSVEDLEKPSNTLADKQLLPWRGASVEKRRPRYRELAAALPTLLEDPRRLRAVPELERFVGKVAGRHREILRVARGR